MTVSGANELGKLQLAQFTFQRVLELPVAYNGNQIFELPPVSAVDAIKRNGFRRGMDRRFDCYLWTRLITSEAGHGRKKHFKISSMYCAGHLRCDNLACPYRKRHDVCNDTDWPTGVHREQKYDSRNFVPKDGHRCPHCNSSAYCVAACGAKTYFVLPSKGKKTSPLPDEASHISRCAIHVGTHCHPPRSSAPRHLVDLVQETVKEEFVKSPSSPPSIVRKKATASLVDKIANSGLIIDMTEEEKYEVFRGILTVAHPDKVLNMIKCIKRSSSPLGELSEIASMQKNTIYRTLQRSLFPGQGGKDSRCFVFKMGTKVTYKTGYPSREADKKHVELCHRIRDSRTVFEAYKVAQEIQEWWKSNVIRSKLKEMQGWLYWWVLRIRQWGNFMREVSCVSKFDTDIS
ncbi:hypothetical protein R1sor_010354 [Riccia sorocarpa]|uniref:Uncharacterized protein n=1 Tax=Riccia sorocarpa TaxID=122646 RepID=A0ABD3HY13_9MARC